MAFSPMQELLDSHVPVWDLNRLRPTWLDDVSHLDRTFPTDEYLDALPMVDHLRAIYLEIDLPAVERHAEFQIVQELLHDPETPFVGAILPGDPVESDFTTWLAEVKREPMVRGLRRVLHTPDQPRGRCLEPAFIEGIRILGEHDLHFEICTRSEELADLATLARAAPDTTLVLDHLGNPPLDGSDLAAWSDDLALVSEQSNVICKVSGLFQNASADWRLEDVSNIINHARGCFGAGRLMFGGNWPVCTLRGSLASWLDAVLASTEDWSSSDREALFNGNAADCYRVD